MQEISETLKRVRKDKKYTMEFVNSKTHIPLKFLNALEEGDVSAFPAEVYMLGSLRRYAKFLTLNDNELIEKYTCNRLKSEEIQKPQKKESTFKPSKAFISSLVFLFLTSGLGVLVYFGNSLYPALFKSKIEPFFNNTKAVNILVDKVVQSNLIEKKTGEINPNLNPVTVFKRNEAKNTGPLTLSVECVEDSWVHVLVDGKDKFDHVMHKGESKQWAAQNEFSLGIGYVSGIKVLLNGKAVDIKSSSHGEINYISLTSKDI